MPVPAATRKQYRTQRALAVAALLEVRRVWRRMSPRGSWDRQWTTLAPTIAAIVARAQRQAVEQTPAYMAAVLDEIGIPATPRGTVNIPSFAGVASDGRNLTDLFYGAVVRSAERFDDGLSATAALTEGRKWLDMTVETQIMDATRVATEVEMAARPAVTGWVRMVSPGACSRCIILAGKFFLYDAGFDRHPRCRCIGIPSTENLAGDFRTNPHAYFDHLSREEQDRIFGKAGAEAVRQGADIFQVVNARRGMHTAQYNLRGWTPKGRQSPVSLFGRDAFVTTEGSTRRGLARRAMGSGRVRLMPETILSAAKDRDDALRLLKLYGFIS